MTTLTCGWLAIPLPSRSPGSLAPADVAPADVAPASPTPS